MLAIDVEIILNAGGGVVEDWGKTASGGLVIRFFRKIFVNRIVAPF
jgi:hypothetical protein